LTDIKAARGAQTADSGAYVRQAGGRDGHTPRKATADLDRRHAQEETNPSHPTKSFLASATLARNILTQHEK
jgi:hypothetical protein